MSEQDLTLERIADNLETISWGISMRAREIQGFARELRLKAAEAPVPSAPSETEAIIEFLGRMSENEKWRLLVGSDEIRHFIGHATDSIRDGSYVDAYRKAAVQAAPAPSDCVCGHERHEHEPDCVFCACEKFTAAQVAPTPSDTLLAACAHLQGVQCCDVQIDGRIGAVLDAAKAAQATPTPISRERASREGMMRDPRVDPRPGDVLRKWEQNCEVLRVAQGCVFTRPSLSAHKDWVGIQYFEAWALSAEVMHTADEPAGRGTRG